MKSEFKVGDKVSYNGSAYFGTVVKITDKRKDVVVKFNTYTETYNSNGWNKSKDPYDTHYIVPLDEELIKQLKGEALVMRTKKLLDEAKKNLTPDKAKRIVEFLENLDKEGEADD